MKLIDTHCHLNYDYEGKSTAQLLEEARAAGVETLITIGTDLPTLSEVQKISENHAPVFHTLGVHPHDASSLDASGLEKIEKAARHPKCVAIGEIGLDYFYEHSPKEIQITALKLQLDLALKLALPVVIHSREGEADLLKLLTEYRDQVPTERIPGVLHCFSGSLEFGEKCLELGFYLSFSGILTFKKADEIRLAAKTFPLDRLLVETDSPYLAPVPFRGKKCEPAMVRLTAEKLAEIKELSLAEIAVQTTANAKRVFFNLS